MQILGQFNTSNMAESRRFFFDTELSSFDDYMTMAKDQKHYLFGGFLEGIGVLVRKKLIDIEMIVYFIGKVTKHHWEKYSPYIVEYRERMNAPCLWIEWEYLYKEIMSYAEKHPELSVQDTEYNVEEA